MNRTLILKLTILASVFLTLAVLEDPADAQTFGSAPGCAYTYEPGGGPWTDYRTDDSYAWVDLHRADGSVDRIQPAPAGTLLPGTAVRVVKCYPALTTPPTTPTPEATPDPTPEVPVPTPTPEAPDPAPNVTVEVLRCNDTDRPNSEAYATADGPGWVDSSGNPLPVGVRVLVAWNSYGYLIHEATGESISIDALGFDSCIPPPSFIPPCGADGVCEEPVFPLPTPDITPDSGSPVPPYGDDEPSSPNGDTSSAPPTPVPGEDLLAYTDSTVTYALLTVGLVFLALGVGLFVGPAIGRRLGEWIGRR